MREAVIVSTARTGLAKSFRGGFNDTEAPAMGGHVVRAAVERAGIDPAEVDDCIFGAAAQQGTQAYNLGRLCALAGGLAETTAGLAIERQCSSGLMSIATAAKSIMCNEYDIAVAGGVESISLVQTKHKNNYRNVSKAVTAVDPTAYMAMIETAEVVSERYGISREAQDAYSLQSQQRTAAAQEAGRFDDEIVPMNTVQALFNKETKETSYQDAVVDRDDCNRPSTTRESLAALEPVFKDGQVIKEGRFITAAGYLPRPRGRRLQVGRDGHRSRLRGTETARASWPGRAGYRPVGTERGFRLPGGPLSR
jgi:acetyl-CoA C-acetyltransferase